AGLAGPQPVGGDPAGQRGRGHARRERGAGAGGETLRSADGRLAGAARPRVSPPARPAVRLTPPGSEVRGGKKPSASTPPGVPAPAPSPPAPREDRPPG